MAYGTEVLHFQLPEHDAATLRSMNQLRSDERFCDVTIIGDCLKFRGHKVILAACSPFLRDQFLLNPTSELQVSPMHSAKVITNLLLSCYTGMLEFILPDIVNYLIAASYLQMEPVVEKCRNLIQQYLEPIIHLKEAAAGREKQMHSKSSDQVHLMGPEQARNRSIREQYRAEFSGHEDLGIKMEMSEEEEDDENYDDQEDDSASELCIVQVENGMEMSQRQQQKQHMRSWAKEAEEAGEQEESQVNSTVENLSTEMEKSHNGVVKASYSFSDDVKGDGLLIIPSSYNDEREAAASSGECESTLGGFSGVLSGLGEENMKDHLRLRNPLKNLKCTKCDETFQGVEKMVFHMRAQHFIFMCPRCGKQFNHSSNLNRHMNIHRGLKSHMCLICGKCFTQKSTLHDHMNLHSGERPYHCSYCNVRFAHKPAIRRHLKEQHGKTTAENIMEASMTEIKVVVG